jgi:hypothetical protein
VPALTVQSACRAAAENGETCTNVEMSVTNTNTAMTMRFQQPNGASCNFAGDYSQTGRRGRSQGKYACTDGSKGSYDAFELDANTQSFSGRFFFHDTDCPIVSGRSAGMKK